MKKFFTYTVVIATIAWSIGLAALVPSASAAYTPVAGDLIKLNLVSAPGVYYVGTDLKKHLFSNRVTFGTWYDNFTGLKKLTSDEFQSVALGNDVIARAGVLVKMEDSNQIYAMTTGGKLCKITSDAAGKALFGTNYASTANFIQTAFAQNYQDRASCDLTSTSNLPNGFLIKYASDPSDKFYIDGGNKRPITADGFTANKFKDSKVYTVPATMTYTAGASLSSRESAVSDVVVSGNMIPVITGNVTASLAAGTPAAGAFPVSAGTAIAGQVPFLKVNITAGASNAVVTSMNVYRGGLSNDNDLNNVYLMDGATVIASNIGMSSGKVVFSQPTGLFTVPAGTTKTITVAADINPVAAGHAFVWSINSASDIVATSQTVGGSFPITGNAISAVQVSNPDLATLTITPTVTGGTVNAGTQAYLAGQLTLQSANSAVSVKSIKLTETGTITAASDLANLKLMVNGAQIGNVAPALNADGTVVFDLSSNPLQITAGQTAVVAIYTDVVSGVSRNFRLTIQRSYDVIATDMTYNVGAAMIVAGNTVNGGVAAAFPVMETQSTVSAGTLSVSRATSSPTGSVAQNATNQVIGNFSMTAYGEAVRITALTYGLDWTGSVAQNTVFDNLKLLDDQGTQIGSTIRSDATAAGQNTASLTSLNYVIPANTTRIFTVKADIKTAGSPVNAILSGVTGQGYVSLNAVGPTGSYTGNPLTINTTPLSDGLNNAVGAISTVYPTTGGVKVASFLLSAGQAEGVNVSSITIKPKTGAAAAFQNLFIKVNGTQIGNVQNATLVDGTPYTFSPATPVSIAAGTSATVDVYADATAAFGAAAAFRLDAVSATGATTSTVLPITGVDGQLVTVGTGGTLTFNSMQALSSQFVSMGVTGVKLASYTFKADNNEPLNLTEVKIKDTGAAATTLTDLINVRLMNGTTQVGVAQGTLSSGGVTTYTITNGATVVPQNGYITLDVIADVNSSANAVSADEHIISVSNVNYQGALSNNSKSVLDAAIVDNGAAFTVYRTNLTAVATPSAILNIGAFNGATVGSFDFTANNSGPATLKTLKLQVQGGAVPAGAVTYTIYNGNTSVGTGSITGEGISATDITIGGSSGLSINPGQKLTLTVKADLSGGTNHSPLQNFQLSLNTYGWDDGSGASITPDPLISLPIPGPIGQF